VTDGMFYIWVALSYIIRLHVCSYVLRIQLLLLQKLPRVSNAVVHDHWTQIHSQRKT